ncbi:MAG: glycosyltransferase [Coriobacteriaceae bacterium]|nr:glycosyltransferase [Coriobacteriaceae bacterium]
MRISKDKTTPARPRIRVLMTTYNGEKTVVDQVESILAQQDVEVALLIADDCSSDATRSILERLAAEHDNIELIFNESNKGCSKNFMDLIYACDVDDCDFVALADQDDVWHPDKLAAAVSCLDAKSDRPELYYAGIDNVGAQGNSLGNEYAPYRVCADNYASLLLVQNWCLGCTTLMNGALVRRLQEHPVYDFARMYDAWIHMVALYTGGRVVCDLEHAHVDRLISEDNLVGVMNERRSPVYLARKATSWALEGDPETSRKHTEAARCLLREYGDQMDADTRELVQAVVERETSQEAREFLAQRDDLVMTSGPRTRWLKSMIRRGRF